MIKLKTIIFLLFILTISGCVTNPEKETIYITKTEVLEIPSALTDPCDIPKPFNKDDYINGDENVKEELFTNTLIDLYFALSDCSTKVLNIKEWNEEQKKLFNSDTK